MAKTNPPPKRKSPADTAPAAEGSGGKKARSGGNDKATGTTRKRSTSKSNRERNNTPVNTPAAGSTSTRSSRSKGGSSLDAKNILRLVRRPTSTCLSIGLCPNFHGDVICEGCRDHFQISCQCNLTKAADEFTTRANNLLCDRVWEDKFAKQDTGKKTRRKNFLKLCGLNEDWVYDDESDTTTNTPRENATKANQSSNEKGDEMGDTSPLPSIALGDKFETAKSSNEKTIRHPRYLVDKNDTITPEAAEQIIRSFKKRKVGTDNQQLEEHEIKLLSELNKFAGNNVVNNNDNIIGEGNIITVAAASAIESALKERHSGNEGLKVQENKMLGQLFTVAANEGNKNDDSKIRYVEKVKSFTKDRSFTLVRVPTQYNSTKSSTRRYIKSASDTAMEWIKFVSNGSSFLEKLVMSIMTDNPEIASECVAAYQTKFKRMTPESTSALMSFVGLNDSQLERLARAIWYYTGMRIFAPKGRIASLKQEYIEQEYKSIEYRMVKLQRKVVKGKNELFRDEWVLVITVRPIEHVLTSIQDIWPDRFVGSEERFRIPFKMHDLFADCILNKMSLDSGGGMSKG